MSKLICERRLLAQPLWTTHIRTASLIEAQFAIDVARETDAYTLADGARFPSACREPQRARGAQIEPLELVPDC